MQGLRAPVRFIFAAAFGASFGLIGALAAASAARAEECPGNADALGTSRVLVLDPGELKRVGSMQYRQTLPLADKEVVLTFDDGPLPRYSNEVLNILAGQCIKATYFLIGSMARAHPDSVRRIYEEGHTIGTHTEDHPSQMQKLARDKVRQEIDEGIADVGAALGDAAELAPFFRIPGLARSDVVEQELAARSLIVFSADAVADDWHHRIKPAEIVHRAMSRLQARGKGILLLHDIHAATVAALPELLKELKEGGFHIVHVVPTAADRIETAGWPWSRTGEHTGPTWPEIHATRSDNAVVLPAPDVRSFATEYRPGHRIILADRSASVGYLALAAAAEWPDPAGTTSLSNVAAVSVPDIRDIGLPLLGAPVVGEMLGLSSNRSLSAADKARGASPPLE
jgi:peptidoglycan-N-acetylglucosamine deacetylase